MDYIFTGGIIMKKILTVLLLLSSFLLVGCEKFQKDKIGGPNTSYENLEIKKIFTKGVIDFFKPETKLTITTLEENAWLEYSNSRIMVFSNNKVYSLETNKYFDIDQAGLSHVIYSYQYILANYETKYLVYHYLTGELLYNIPRNQNDDYLFNEDYISVRGLNQSGDYVEKERYEFRDYKPLVQDGLEKEDPLKVERKIKLSNLPKLAFSESLHAAKENIINNAIVSPINFFVISKLHLIILSALQLKKRLFLENH
jgi:hypothetical protein